MTDSVVGNGNFPGGQYPDLCDVTGKIYFRG